MSEHYGNLNISGRLAVSQNLSAGYQLPDEIGNQYDLLGVIDPSSGKLVFGSVEDFDIATLTGLTSAFSEIDLLQDISVYTINNAPVSSNNININIEGFTATSTSQGEVTFTINDPPPINFLDLEDTPDDYTGQNGKVVTVSGGKLIFDAIPTSVYGSVACSVGVRVYEIDYGFVNDNNQNYPQVSLVIPASSSDLFVQGIFDVNNEGFKVALSNTPDVSGYAINWSLTDANARPISVGGEGNTEKLIPVASALIPASSGADLSVLQNNAGMLFDSLDFEEFETAYFNFPMVEAFPGGDVYLSLNMTADTSGQTTVEVKIDSLSAGEDYSSSNGYTAKSTIVSVNPNIITKTVITMENPTYQEIEPGDLVIVKIRRQNTGTLLSDLRLVSLKLYWV